MSQSKKNVLVVQIFSKKYETFFDRDKQQRFISDPYFVKLYDFGCVNAIKIHKAFINQNLTEEEYLQFFIKLGYSIKMVLKLFPDLEIRNLS